MILGVRANRTRGHRYRREVVIDVHVKIGGHREDVPAGSIPEGLRGSRDDPVQFAEKLRARKSEDRRLFSLQHSKSRVRVHHAVHLAAQNMWLLEFARSFPRAAALIWRNEKNSRLDDVTLNAKNARRIQSKRCTFFSSHIYR